VKNLIKISIIFLLIFIITGCGNIDGGRNSIKNDNSVDKVIDKQIANATSSASDVLEQEPIMLTEKSLDELLKTEKKTDETKSDSVDYDLTEMSSDMVYAVVYHMMIDPATYIGKSFRIEGLYYAFYNEPADLYHHYCIVQDAAACCAQGLEFVWDDGTHVYPDEYPEDNTKVIIEGTFETYHMEGDSNLYGRLKDATFLHVF